MEGERNGERTGERHGDGSDALAGAAQSRRPPYTRRATSDGNDAHHRPKHQKRVVGGGGARFSARVPSSKALHTNKATSQSTAKLKGRAASPEPERPPQFANAHRRTTSDLRLTAVASDPNDPIDPAVDYNLDLANPNPNPNPASSKRHSRNTSGTHIAPVITSGLKKNISGSNIASRRSGTNITPAAPPVRKNTSGSNLASRRNRSHVEIAKRSKSTANIKRASSHKDVQKLKGAKNQVHFALGSDDDDDDDAVDDEWVDASNSASPYLSRRGSVQSGGQSPAKPPSPTSHSPSGTPTITTSQPFDSHDDSPTRQRTQRTQHNNYITSRLLQRTPSHGAPPQMSTETVSVPPPSGSPPSQGSRGPSSLYGTPKTSTLGASGPEEVVSRFINGSGPGSGGRGDDYFVPSHPPVRRTEAGFRRPQSLGNLNHASRDSVSDEEEAEADSALAPRSRTPRSRAVPASQSRIQQKLNLQRASSSIEPAQAGPGVGVVGASLLVGNTDYEHRDPRIGRLLERAQMEYLVVRRYQNPIARSIGRLVRSPSTHKNQSAPKQNGTSGTDGTMVGGKSSAEKTGRPGQSKSMVQIAQSRPTTPRRSTSIRMAAVGSSYTGDDTIHDRASGSSYVEGNDDSLASLLRNLWDKNMDLGASQE
ncbi:hypothetical protein F4808DRAFT_344003 [Astrocystis sublimbata]|nr:hypothetical protein F4808DRAFT_344003 [Astrocystis sublimbata]